jgi:uncharacterized protein (TIGR02996 family)
MTAADAHVPFLRAIVAAPDDDLPRLIFADWLDEYGEGERAEFIRVQCELARTSQGRMDLHASVGGVEEIRRRDVDDVVRRSDGKLVDRINALCRRERELSMRHCGPWLQRQLSVPNPGPWIETGQVRYTSQREPDTEVTFRRGFVEEIACTGADWLRHHAAIRAVTPLRRAVLTTPLTWDFRPEAEEVPGSRTVIMTAEDETSLSVSLPSGGWIGRSVDTHSFAILWPGVAVEVRPSVTWGVTRPGDTITPGGLFTPGSPGTARITLR